MAAQVVIGALTFVVFGALAVVMAMSLRNDYRRARDRDQVSGTRRERLADVVFGLEGWWAVAICAVVAILGAAAAIAG